MAKLQGVFQAKVMARYMKEDEIKKFAETYNDNLHLQKDIREPSQNDIRIASHLRKTKNWKETAKAMGVTEYRVGTAIKRVGVYGK